MSNLIERVQALADEVLFPAALEVDQRGEVPASHWDLLAAEGMYGLAAPAELGGAGLQLPEIIGVLETMAGGCLATTFTWMQHHGALFSIASSSNTALRDGLVPGLVSGRTRAGVAFAGVIPDPPRMRARRTADGWLLTGDGPFVSGWGIVQVLQVSAGDVETDDVIAVVIEARQQPGITLVEPIHLVAANATKTVSIRLDELAVTDEQVVSRVPRDQFLANQLLGARLNGTLPLGLTTRCARLLEAGGHTGAAERLRADCTAVRGRLDAGLADVATMVSARADGAELALRAAAALVTAGGGPALATSSHAQRLAREAVFTLVAASRAELKRELLDRYTTPPTIGGRHCG